MKARLAISLTLPFLLMACAGGREAPETMSLSPVKGPVNIICSTDLTARFGGKALADPAIQAYIAGLNAELSGRLVEAVPHYTRAAGFTPVPLDISCENQWHQVGDSRSNALTSLQKIKTVLMAHDAQLSPNQPLHEGLPKSQSNVNATAAPTRTSPAVSTPSLANRDVIPVTAPMALDPLGRWFAHMTSYFNAAESENGRAALAKEFPALEEYLEAIEGDINGRPVWRVGVRLSDQNAAKALCNAVSTHRDYCAVLEAS